MIRRLLLLFAFLLAALPWGSVALAQPVAQVGEWTLDLADVDEKLAHKLYELRDEMIQEMVVDHLLALEAKALGIEQDQVLEEQVNKKIHPLTEEDVQSFIDANKSRLPDGGEGMKDKIRAYLQNKLETNLQETFIQSLSRKYQVKLLLQPPRTTVPGPQDLARGKADAPVTIIEFSDFECPYCRRAQKVVHQVEEHYGDKIRFVFRHFPLPFHEKAPKASEAAQCAQDQGKFWPFHHALFDDGTELSVPAYKALARKLQLNTKTFNDCLDSGRQAQRVAADLEDGRLLGISGTPTFFVNGIRLVGAVPFEEFRSIIDMELGL